MPPRQVCDQGGCPAGASRHIELYRQDFHFCNHHWMELASVIGEHVEHQNRPLDQECANEDLMLFAAGPANG